MALDVDKLRMFGDPPQLGQANLILRTREEEGFRTAHLFAVLPDGSEHEIVDCIKATWETTDDAPTRAVLTVEGVKLDADFECRAAIFEPGQAVWSNDRGARIAHTRTAIEAELVVQASGPLSPE